MWQVIFSRGLQVVDWFVPETAKLERSELSLARNFVFTHLFGPALSQAITVFLYRTDSEHGLVFWTMALCIAGFWTLPFVLKFSGSLQISATISVLLLAFASLFGAFNYGGVSSPFLPWILVCLLLGFFYLSDQPLRVIGMFTLTIGGFFLAYLTLGFPQRIPLENLVSVGWISILSATAYMAWMANYYASIMSMRSDLERETERHQATAVRLLRAKDEAEAANKAKSIFLAKMSHELRTPLNAVIGYCEILLEEADARKAQRIKDLEQIRAAGKHLLSLVTDVLDLSSIESNKTDLKCETIALKTFVDEVVGTTRHLVRGNGNKLVVDTKDAIGAVTTDVTKLRQIVINLLSNAAKFTKGGVVSISAQRLKLDVADWIEIRVQDTGVGISQNEMQRLFKDYGQANIATSSRFGGTGLGLALSQKLCNLIGGAISVTSDVGRGSIFVVRIPAQISDLEDLQFNTSHDSNPFSSSLAAA